MPSATPFVPPSTSSGPTSSCAPSGTAQLRPARGASAVLVVALGTCLTLAGAGAAAAHVRVVPESTAGGAWTKLTFRVPTESATAGTTQLQVQLPTDSPLVHVSVQPVPGWSAVVESAALHTPVDVGGAQITQAPSTVTWTADPGVQIAPGEFQEFAISAGPLPDEGTTLAFAALQTYSDGTVVAWDEVAADGAEEPERPAPTFTTTTAAAHGHGAATDATPDASSTATGEATDVAATGHDAAHASVETAEGDVAAGGDPVGRGLGALGALLGAAGLWLGLRRRGPAAVTAGSAPGPEVRRNGGEAR